MRKLSWLVPVALVLVFSGCAKDARIKRAASLSNTKMKVEAAEYWAATTPEKKLEIADHHFRTMPKFTQVVDDYMHGREPSGPTPDEVKAEVKRRKTKAELIRVNE